MSPVFAYSSQAWQVWGILVRCKPFTSRTWMIKAITDEVTTESCSIATLMKHPLLFINSFYKESIWSEKACQVLCVKFTFVQGSTVKINRETGEAHSQHNFLTYIWRTQSHLGTLNTVFLDICISHKARYQLTQAKSGLRLLPQFLGAFSQGQMPHTSGKVPLLAPTARYIVEGPSGGFFPIFSSW
jgi:hypothetical protein